MGNNHPTFGSRLKTLRKEAGYKTQVDFADAFGRSLDTIQNWEQGKTFPPTKDILELCTFLCCDADYLLGRLDKPTHDLDFVCKYTGLSARSIEVLRNIPKWEKTGADANNDLDYFISNYGEELAFYLGEIRHRRSRAAIEKGEIEKSINSNNRFQMSTKVSERIRDIDLALFSFSEFCREIPENLYGTSKLLRKLRALYEQLHEYREQEGKDDGQ